MPTHTLLAPEYYGNCDLASEDESQQDQKEEIGTDKSVTKCHVTESEDVEILTSSTLDTDPQCFSVPHPTIPDLSEASLPPKAKPDRSPDECRAGDTTENSDDISPSPGWLAACRFIKPCQHQSLKNGTFIKKSILNIKPSGRFMCNPPPQPQTKIQTSKRQSSC